MVLVSRIGQTRARPRGKAEACCRVARMVTVEASPSPTLVSRKSLDGAEAKDEDLPRRNRATVPRAAASKVAAGSPRRGCGMRRFAFSLSLLSLAIFSLSIFLVAALSPTAHATEYSY